MSEFTPAAGTVTMFTTTWCGYCRRLKSQMEREGIGFLQVDIEAHPAAGVVMGLNGGNQTVPALVFPDGTAATNPLDRAGQGPPGLVRPSGANRR